MYSLNDSLAFPGNGIEFGAARVVLVATRSAVYDCLEQAHAGLKRITHRRAVGLYGARGDEIGQDNIAPR